MRDASIYLDSAATTQVYPEAVEAIISAMQDAYGNPSSPHAKGLEAERLVKEARRTVASVFGVEPQEIVFTSGATESNNLAIKGAARAKSRQGRHLVVSTIEHTSVINAASDLEDEGFELSWVDPDPNGIIAAESVRAALRHDTVLVSVMAVNNETGCVQPLREIASMVKNEAPKALIHSDGVQAFGKMPFHPGRLGIDLVAVTGHKFHAPKGVGALYVRKGIRLKALMGGGEHEGGLRSGTENVPGLVGLRSAASISGARQAAARERWSDFRAYMIERLLKIEGSRLNGCDVGESVGPHILNLSFAGIPGEVLVSALSERGVYVSTGSACTSKGGEPKKGSHVLRAMGVPDAYLSGAIRISFSFLTTRDEVEKSTSIIEQTVSYLRETLE